MPQPPLPPLPPLPGAYLSALKGVLTQILEQPVQAVLLAGSAAAGTLRPPTSDLDLLVLDESPWQTYRERHTGVTVHVGRGSPEAWQALWQREMSGELGANIALMAGSLPLYDPQGVGLRLRSEAEALHQQGPRLPAESRELRRRTLTVLAHDLLAANPENGPYLCSLLTGQVVVAAFVLNGRWRPRHREAMQNLKAFQPALAAAVSAALRYHTPAAYADLVRETERLLLPHGGWLDQS